MLGSFSSGMCLVLRWEKSRLTRTEEIAKEVTGMHGLEA